MYSLIIDLILVFIVLFCIIISAKKGFVRTFVEVIGTVIVIYLVITLSNPVSEFVYKKTIEPSIVSSAEKSIEKTTEKTFDSLWKSFPKIVTNNSEFFGISEKSLSEKIKPDKETKEQIAKTAADTVAKPMIVHIISLIISTVGIIALLFVVRLLAKLLNKVFNFSVIGKLNRFLGGVIGIFKGLAFASIFCILIMFLISIQKNGFWIFTNQSVKNTYIFKYLYGILPFKF